MNMPDVLLDRIELDLQEATRRDDSYVALNELIEGLQKVSAFPPLVWLYVWDMVKDKLDYYHPDSHEEYAVNPALTEKDVFNLFWEDADKNGFSLEYGTEQLHDHVFDWMIDREILVVLDEDGWLDDVSN